MKNMIAAMCAAAAIIIVFSGAFIIKEGERSAVDILLVRSRIFSTFTSATMEWKGSG